MRNFLNVLAIIIFCSSNLKAQNIVELGVYSVFDDWEFEGVKTKRYGYTDPYLNIAITHYFLRENKSFKVYGGIRGSQYFRRAGLYRTKSLIMSFENGVSYNLHFPRRINFLPFIGYVVQIPPYGNDDLMEFRNFRTFLINGGLLVNDVYNKRIGIKASIDLKPFATIVSEDLPIDNLNRKFRVMLNATVKIGR